MSPAQKFNRAVRTALLLTGCGLLGACDAGGFPGWRKLAALGMGPRQETAVAAHGGPTKPIDPEGLSRRQWSQPWVTQA